MKLGDTVIVHRRHALSGVGEIVKVTASGQMAVAVEGNTLRFMPSGFQVGGDAWIKSATPESVALVVEARRREHLKAFFAKGGASKLSKDKIDKIYDLILSD